MDIKAQTLAELQARFETWGHRAYRVRQLLEWLYFRRVTDWEAMTNLPKALRDQLRSHYALRCLKLIRKQGARDTTQKFLWQLPDHALIESVLIPASPALYGEPSDRHTLCISTQVGCAYGCKFCASGLAGWKRNLEVEEIVDQVLAVERWNAEGPKVRSSQAAVHSPEPEVQGRPGAKNEQSAVDERRRNAESSALDPRPSFPLAHHAPSVTLPSHLVSNLVVMGMGEPLANYGHLLKALTILNAPWGGGIGARKITISTSGLAPQIRKLAEEPLQFRLAVSLHGATDAVRSRIMPVNRKHPLRELAAACEYYQQKKGRMITFEYVLIAGVNDGMDQVKPLAALARRLNAKVNLIAYNRVEGLAWERPSETQQEAFLDALRRQKVGATLRREKGHDIDAACGQLRLKTERELKRLPALDAAN